MINPIPLKIGKIYPKLLLVSSRFKFPSHVIMLMIIIRSNENPVNRPKKYES